MIRRQPYSIAGISYRSPAKPRIAPCQYMEHRSFLMHPCPRSKQATSAAQIGGYTRGLPR